MDLRGAVDRVSCFDVWGDLGMSFDDSHSLTGRAEWLAPETPLPFGDVNMVLTFEVGMDKQSIRDPTFAPRRAGVAGRDNV